MHKLSRDHVSEFRHLHRNMSLETNDREIRRQNARRHVLLCEKLYSFFNMRTHITKIMSIIIIVVVIAYRLTHPFFNHSRSHFTGCCFPTLENCAAKTSRRCHKCLFLETFEDPSHQSFFHPFAKSSVVLAQ